jgi:hypothetical protein
MPGEPEPPSLPTGPRLTIEVMVEDERWADRIPDVAPLAERAAYAA